MVFKVQKLSNLSKYENVSSLKSTWSQSLLTFIVYRFSSLFAVNSFSYFGFDFGPQILN